MNNDIELFVERHGAADALDVSAVQGIEITQAIEKIVYLPKDLNPSIPADEFEGSLPDRALEEAPYTNN